MHLVPLRLQGLHQHQGMVFRAPVAVAVQDMEDPHAVLGNGGGRHQGGQSGGRVLSLGLKASPSVGSASLPG